ncbi:uncharacterized protein LOC115216475 isoform X2 [Octopus sinensis]|uniref:Uncharacterized protein LOC115216475 isoform X2 n=1 Tax=Octopus sinensis TaxID=2607531 RepID=A0A7E6F4B3_9MOLL|nr:uncharacterized protein LOC115216475 isoform X2 [Octopus sinensis]
MASSVKRLQTLFIVLLIVISVQLVKPEQLTNLKRRDLKDNLQSLYDLFADNFDDDDNGYARDDNSNESPSEYGSEADGDVSRLETVPPSPWYNFDDDEVDTSDSYDYKYDNDNESGSGDDEDISTSGTVSPSTWYYMITDRTTSPTDRTLERKNFSNDNMQEGNEGGRERVGQVLVPKQLQQDWQEQQQKQGEYQRVGLETQEQTQQEQQQQQQQWQQQQYQTGEQQQQQQTSLNSSVIANSNATYQGSSAFVSSQKLGSSSTTESAASNKSSYRSNSNEQSNPLCSTEVDLYDLCNLSMYPGGVSYANPFTFRLLENAISHNTTRQSLKSCRPGHWCLGTNVTEGKLENFPRHFCWSSLLTCLDIVVEQLKVCPAYQKYTTILSSLVLVCDYFDQDPELKQGPQCGVRLLEMVSVTFSDMEREIPQVQEVDQCNSRTGLMQSSFRCLMNSCNVLERTTTFLRFQPWQWFIASLDSYDQCPLNCSRGELYESTVYITEEPNTEGSTRRTLVTDPVTTAPPTNGGDGEGVADLQYNSVHKSGQTGSSIQMFNAWNIGLIATSVAVLLIVLFIIIAVMAWRRLKGPQDLRNQGYSKLKTGEC